MKKRLLGLQVVVAAVLGLGVLGAAHSAEQELTLAVSEGTSGGLDHGMALAKYGGLADAISRAAGRKVNILFAREFSTLEQGLREGRFDLALARPSDYPARAIRDHGYRFVASAKPDGQCLIVVPKASPIQAPRDAKGLRWVLPEPASYMAKLCTAELRDGGIDLRQEKLKSVREQGAVNFFLTQKFGDIGGVASYSGAARGLEKAGLRVLLRGSLQPYFPMVAGPKVSAEQLRAIQAELTALGQSDAGRAVLNRIGVEGFDTSTGPRLDALLKRLEG